MNDLIYDYKKVWQKKDDDTLEYKEWFIFTLKIEEPIKNKIEKFINQQLEKYKHNNNLTPKIIKLNKQTASSFGYSSFTDNNGFTYHDNISGSLQENELTYNSYLQRELINYKYISFTPEVIINIYYTDNDNTYYIYPLDNNQQKTIYNTFYWTLTPNYKNLSTYITKFNILQDKTTNTLLIPTNHFNSFIKLFQTDILTKSYHLFDSPNKTIKDYLFKSLNRYDNLIIEEELNNLLNKHNNFF